MDSHILTTSLTMEMINREMERLRLENARLMLENRALKEIISITTNKGEAENTAIVKQKLVEYGV